MARRAVRSESSVATAFLNIVLKDQDGNEFTLGGKALPSGDSVKGQTLPCRVVRKLWATAENLPTGEFPFQTHGSFQNFLSSFGLEVVLKVRRTDDETTDATEADDISF